MLASASGVAGRFQLILIKSSHYGEEGYVIQWVRSSIPSNSLACVYTLAQDAAARGVLGATVAIDITAIDETNTRVKIKNIIALIRRHGGFGMVGLVGAATSVAKSKTKSINLDYSRAYRRCVSIRWQG